ncbi:hypothetical protein M406DRAFT_39996 [Cryphonectria parasitica EP155]|uniref:Zn(2)-C6 fungal-type domain-containing protein n=1 Tax=Cryphonectria parasitica (strain ATCC 38755 / EP155) TaxID=660469 RepID=A0A9P4Y656_CRYP1|nr:uncharacterized protein M406DRAFT_39996 [Cryphonectria parasitica EP155]KAF3767679.1 hypothetical protein M406DRAFT_39996 [Cryphonectria parasitica EP155]
MLNKENSPPKKPNIRKRTKTGCLTCRKRRIKCDEGKPICNNCIKSKRQCEGYNQRVVFKSPMGAIPGSHFGPLPYHHHHDPTEALVNAQLTASQGKTSSSAQGPLPIIAPKPPNLEYGNPAHYPYIHGHPGLHRANSTASLGLGVHQSQYVMGAIPTETYYAQSGLEMTASPTRTSQPALFDLQQMPTPQQQPPNGFTLPERRHTSHSIIGRPAPMLHQMTLNPPIAQSYSATGLEPSEEAGSWVFDEGDLSLDSEDDEILANNHLTSLDANDIGSIMTNDLDRSLDPYGTQVRSFHALAHENVLVNYMPSLSDTPLNDAKTRDIFWYFVNITAPAINPYERNPSRPFSGEPIPRSSQHIWTYVFPLQSFHHPALLQAILALGSLQMAELAGGAPTAPWVHSSRCISRIAKIYQSAERRAQPSTLAATLLLAFFEVWTSNHDKWCTHMMGARQIIRETPFRQMSRQIWTIHRQRYQQWADHPSHELAEVDLDLLRTLTGKQVYFAEGAGCSWQPNMRSCTALDLENYEHLADLYWWFCKMDVYQAMLGGSKLFMEYELWTQCPPRAPMNRINQIFGTFDHLVLLLGRVANYAATDLPRKHRARARERGGANTSPKGPNSPPMFAGMFPGRGSIQLPRGLSPPRDSFVSAAEQAWEDLDLESSTQKATEEWTAILAAFNLFKQSLGADFQALSEDVQPARESPFGPTCTYRTYSIAGIWMNFYMGLVVLHRSHPSMPPFAMIAAHMCAKQTEPFSNEIGRIVAGITEDWTAETMFRDRLQRQWAIRRLHDITRMTGWKTGKQIANGCEGAWRKAAAMGVTPPYEPEAESAALRHGYTTRRIDERIQEIGDGQSRPVLKRKDRAHVAFGLLSVDEDLERLSLED